MSREFFRRDLTGKMRPLGYVELNVSHIQGAAARDMMLVPIVPSSAVSPAQRVTAESEEKARSAYEKVLRPFHRLRTFSELAVVIGFEPPSENG